MAQVYLGRNSLKGVEGATIAKLMPSIMSMKLPKGSRREVKSQEVEEEPEEEVEKLPKGSRRGSTPSPAFMRVHIH